MFVGVLFFAVRIGKVFVNLDGFRKFGRRTLAARVRWLEIYRTSVDPGTLLAIDIGQASNR